MGKSSWDILYMSQMSSTRVYDKRVVDISPLHQTYNKYFQCSFFDGVTSMLPRRINHGYYHNISLWYKGEKSRWFSWLISLMYPFISIAKNVKYTCTYYFMIYYLRSGPGTTNRYEPMVFVIIRTIGFWNEIKSNNNDKKERTITFKWLIP